MRIALISESTYPFSVNGVSVWCDQLMQGMSEHEWEVVAICADGSERQHWAAPRNLKEVHRLPVWGPRPAGRGPAGAPGPEFRSAFTALCAAMLAPNYGDETGNARAFLAALKQLHDYSESGGDLTAALTSDLALRLTANAWNQYRDKTHAGTMTLADAVTGLWIIEHLLRPMSAQLPEVDLMHSSMNGLSMLVAMAAKWRHGTPIVMSEHGIYLRERYIDQETAAMSHPVRTLVLSFHRQLASAGYLLLDALAPHAVHNRRWETRFGVDPKRFWTVYNGVEPTQFPAHPEPAEPTIVFMGRVDPIKDLHTLIRAFAIVHAEIPGARLRIFGDTSAANSGYRNSCVDLITELEIAGAATLEGRVATQADAYRQGQIVALTSISEGFPYTVVEAMACGRPVVCTNVGGVSEAVGDAGMMVPARDHEAVARACITMLRDHKLRAELGVAARRRVLEHFTLAGSIDVYRRLYKTLDRPTQVAGASVSARRPGFRVAR